MRKSEYTKSYILKYALIMVEKEELVTAKALTNFLKENNKNIGWRSVANYLRMLQDEGQL